MMDWLSDNPERGETVLAIGALGISVLLIWLGILLLGTKNYH